MAKISRPTGLYSIFIGIVGFYYMYGIWKALNSSSTAHGNNYILVTLALIFGTIYWQSKQIEKFTQRSFKDILFSQDIKKRKKGALIFSISVGVATFIAIILSQCIVWFSSKGWLHETAIFYSLKYTGLVHSNDIPSIPWLIIGLIFLLIFSMVISASVFMALFMGTTFTCFSVIIALHNWFNGGSFDIGMFLEALSNLKISNFLSYLIVIGQFLISQFITSGD